ncbi:hypothetical protein SADUNF_Sadunf09G0033000 [Salix dunnii]|uniref:Uncharacterized protein n=1 Tax=Salix dunnii TaxID=1413687 RepID=A0A835JV63_9ROSI|nr:hypothetical protein SADUNF_Sadunf09G0033000 [Salix dunnii]
MAAYHIDVHVVRKCNIPWLAKLISTTCLSLTESGGGKTSMPSLHCKSSFVALLQPLVVPCLATIFAFR